MNDMISLNSTISGCLSKDWPGKFRWIWNLQIERKRIGGGLGGWMITCWVVRMMVAVVVMMMVEVVCGG
ncbi:hypothetical protein HanOQP8_Chr13g0502731 [Helianthus annuus]|nr:hypothetical protein HanOQP8_Chr13g0502731 [Helianthus annuus]